jgi:xylitol oxidase
MATTHAGSNWSGNYAYRARTLHHPRTVAELQELVARSRTLRALGSRHSFTDVADSDELVALDALPGAIELDTAAGTVTVPGHTTYAELAAVLNRSGRALHNMASLPHISVAGAIATATHGSGDAKGNLATAVRAIEMVCAGGELVTVAQGDADFTGVVVGLGALGIVTRVTLEVQPFFQMRQRVFEGVSWNTLFQRFEAIFSAGESVSVFHLCGAGTEQVWVKRRSDGDGGDDRDLEELLGVRAADAPCTVCWAPTPSTARSSWACSGHGLSGYRTLAPGSPPARARSSNPSSSSPATTLLQRSRRCAGSPMRSSRSCSSPSCARSPPTGCG